MDIPGVLRPFRHSRMRDREAVLERIPPRPMMRSHPAPPRPRGRATEIAGAQRSLGAVRVAPERYPSNLIRIMPA